MADADAPVTTLVPFGTLPSCVTNCGPLYDANGGCVPPGAAEGSEDTYTSCFCQHNAVQGLYSDPPSDVCNGNCAADPTGYTSLRDWFTDYCTGVRAEVADATTTADASDSTGGSSSGSAGGDWLSSHWRWVVMLIIIFVGLVAIWVGACIWRRRYLKKKERIYKLGKNNAARTSGTGVWAPGSGVDMQHRGSVPNPNGAPVLAPPQPQMPIQPPDLVMTPAIEKKGSKKSKSKKKWIVKERT